MAIFSKPYNSPEFVHPSLVLTVGCNKIFPCVDARKFCSQNRGNRDEMPANGAGRAADGGGVQPFQTMHIISHYAYIGQVSFIVYTLFRFRFPYLHAQNTHTTLVFDCTHLYGCIGCTRACMRCVQSNTRVLYGCIGFTRVCFQGRLCCHV